MRKILLTIFLSVLVHSLFCQPDSILRNFKYRIGHYKAIGINVDGAGAHSNTDFPAGTTKSSSSAGNVGASYYFIKSTDRVLLNASGGIFSSFNFGKSKNTTGDNRNKSFYSSLYFNLLNKWFNRNFFTELGADGSSGLQTYKMTATNLPGSAKNNQQDHSLAIHTGIGKGRLENITDMQNALWLYKALTEENKFSRSLSGDELDELGRMITKANNTRVLDSRKRTQFVLETIDNFFQKKGLINVADIRYFSNLNDILFFAFNSNRLSGTEKYIRLTPAIDYFNTDVTDNTLLTKSESSITTKSVSLSAGFSRYHPVNLQHQNDYGIALFLNYISQDYTDRFYDSGILTNQLNLNPEIKQAGINLFFRHSIYLNTRTSISFNLQSETGYVDVGQNNSFFGRTELSGLLNYFISYRTRFSCNLGAAYQKNYYQVYPAYQCLALLPDNWQLFANAGIAVSL